MRRQNQAGPKYRQIALFSTKVQNPEDRQPKDESVSRKVLKNNQNLINIIPLGARHKSRHKSQAKENQSDSEHTLKKITIQVQDQNETNTKTTLNRKGSITKYMQSRTASNRKRDQTLKTFVTQENLQCTKIQVKLASPLAKDSDKTVKRSKRQKFHTQCVTLDNEEITEPKVQVTQVPDKRPLSRSRGDCFYQDLEQRRKSFSKNKHPHQSNSRSASLNKKLRTQACSSRIQDKLMEIKHEYEFVREHLNDLELEGILNQLHITGVPECRWSLIVVDKVYQLIRRQEFSISHEGIVRKF